MKATGLGVDKTRVFCILCTGERKEAGLSYCGSTTSLYNHLNNHHPNEWSEAEEEVKKKSYRIEYEYSRKSVNRIMETNLHDRKGG